MKLPTFDRRRGASRRLSHFQPSLAVLPTDAPTKMGEVTAVCTGVGSAKDDPQWSSYPIKLEFSNGGAQFVSGENVKLMSSTGAQLAEFDCGGPWVLLALAKRKLQRHRDDPAGQFRTALREVRHAGHWTEARRDPVSRCRA